MGERQALIQLTGQRPNVRIVFLGTPAFAEPVLRALLGGKERGWSVVGVITQPDRPAGRSETPQPPPIKVLAEAHDVPVFQPLTLRNNAGAEILTGLRPDVGVLFSYGQILPRSMLRVPARGILNIHPSLLPKYRGPSPVQTCLLQGGSETGVSLIQLVAKMDAGPIVAQERLSVSDGATTPQLLESLAVIGSQLVTRSLDAWVAGDLSVTVQDESLATYSRLLTREDAQINWARSCFELDRQVRALQPWPGTYTMWNERPLKVLRASPLEWETGAPPGTIAAVDGKPAPSVQTRWATTIASHGGVVVAAGSGCLVLHEVQIAGGRPLDAAKFARGQSSLLGQRLGASL